MFLVLSFKVQFLSCILTLIYKVLKKQIYISMYIGGQNSRRKLIMYIKQC